MGLSDCHHRMQGPSEFRLKDLLVCREGRHISSSMCLLMFEHGLPGITVDPLRIIDKFDGFLASSCFVSIFASLAEFVVDPRQPLRLKQLLAIHLHAPVGELTFDVQGWCYTAFHRVTQVRSRYVRESRVGGLPGWFEVLAFPSDMSFRGSRLSTVIAFVLTSVVEGGDKLLSHISSALHTAYDSLIFFGKAGVDGGGVSVYFDQLLHPGSGFPVPLRPGSRPRGCHVYVLFEVLVWHGEDADGFFLNLPHFEIFVDRKAIPNIGFDE